MAKTLFVGAGALALALTAATVDISQQAAGYLPTGSLKHDHAGAVKATRGHGPNGGF